MNYYMIRIDSILRSVTVSREIKLLVYMLMETIATNFDNETDLFMKQFLEYADLGRQGSLQLLQSNNSEDVLYSENLNEKILELYIAILLSISNYKNDTIFRSKVNDII